MDADLESNLLSIAYRTPTISDHLSNMLVQSESKEQFESENPVNNVGITQLLDGAATVLNHPETLFEKIKSGSCQIQMIIPDIEDFDSDEILNLEEVHSNVEPVPLELKLSLLNYDLEDSRSSTKTTDSDQTVSIVSDLSSSASGSSLTSVKMEPTNNFSCTNQSLINLDDTPLSLEETADSGVEIKVEPRFRLSPERNGTEDGHTFSCAYPNEEIFKSDASSNEIPNDYRNSASNNVTKSNTLAINCNPSEDTNFLKLMLKNVPPMIISVKTDGGSQKRTVTLGKQLAKGDNSFVTLRNKEDPVKSPSNDVDKMTEVGNQSDKTLQIKTSSNLNKAHTQLPLNKYICKNSKDQPKDSNTKTGKSPTAGSLINQNLKTTGTTVTKFKTVPPGNAVTTPVGVKKRKKAKKSSAKKRANALHSLTKGVGLLSQAIVACVKANNASTNTKSKTCSAVAFPGNVPKTGSNSSSFSGNVPKTGSNSSSSSGNVPKTGSNSSSSSGNVPKTGSNSSSSSGNVPKARSNSSSSSGNVPKAQSNSSSSSGNVPKAQSNSSSSSGNVPKAQSNSSSSSSKQTKPTNGANIRSEDAPSKRKFVKAKRGLHKQKQQAISVDESDVNDRVQWVCHRWNVETLSDQDINLTTASYIRRKLPVQEVTCFQGCLEGQKDYTLAIVAPNRKRKLHHDDANIADSNVSKKRRLGNEVGLIPGKNVKELSPDRRLVGNKAIELLEMRHSTCLLALDRQRDQEMNVLNEQYHYMKYQLEEKHFQERQYFNYYRRFDQEDEWFRLQYEHNYEREQFNMTMSSRYDDVIKKFINKANEFHTFYNTSIEKLKLDLSVDETETDSDFLTIALRTGPNRKNGYKTTHRNVCLTSQVALAMIREDEIYDSIYSHKSKSG